MPVTLCQLVIKKNCPASSQTKPVPNDNGVCPKNISIGTVEEEYRSMIAKEMPPEISDPDAGSRILGYEPYSPVSIDGFTPVHHIRRGPNQSRFNSFAQLIEVFRRLLKRARLR
jgi:hypothetical protein